MKHIIITLAILILFAVSANAELFNRGTDSLGNQLIYDDDLDITWYDYTHYVSGHTWSAYMAWADTLSINFGGTTYDNWRLPSSDACGGYDCTGSEMGHLYYTELGNTSQAGPIQNVGDFQPFLYNFYYWSSREGLIRGEEHAMVFRLNDTTYAYSRIGFQVWDLKVHGGYAMAVRDGDVAAIVPEPISSILFLTGGGVLAGRRYFRKKLFT